MDNTAQLQTYSNDLAKAVASLVQQGGVVHQSTMKAQDTQRTEENILSIVSKIKNLLCKPSGLLQHLATQSQILACLQWLGEFQILACIPLVGNVPIKNVAVLAGVPESHLARIIRLTTTVGFLGEPQPGHVAHTHLSAPFVTDPSLLDAAMFLSESYVPTALQMAQSTLKFGDSQQPNRSAYSLTLAAGIPFHAVRGDRPKLSRQWHAYLRHAGGLHAAAEYAPDILAQLNWAEVATAGACIVEAGVRSLSASMARRLAEQHPAQNFIVQISGTAGNVAAQNRELQELKSPISLTSRALGTRQPAADAAVYILHLPFSSPSLVLAELTVHLDVLRARTGILLILTARLLPEPGTIPDPEVEAVARSRDLAFLQLANEGEMEVTELSEMIETVRDSVGGLVVTKRLHSCNNLVVALVAKYQLGGTSPWSVGAES